MPGKEVKDCAGYATKIAVGDPSVVPDLVRDIAGALDRRYNKTPAARVWSNVDVKGFARSMIPALRKAGITALYQLLLP
eukprot:gene34480-11679_t